MNTSNTSILKFSTVMPSLSSAKLVASASNWLVRVGSMVLAASIKNGEYRARRVIANRCFSK